MRLHDLPTGRGSASIGELIGRIDRLAGYTHVPASTGSGPRSHLTSERDSAVEHDVLREVMDAGSIRALL
jgi:hypothetical protein